MFSFSVIWVSQKLNCIAVTDFSEYNHQQSIN